MIESRNSQDLLVISRESQERAPSDSVLVLMRTFQWWRERGVLAGGDWSRGGGGGGVRAGLLSEWCCCQSGSAGRVGLLPAAEEK